MIWKCTFFFVSGRTGWTESYYTDQASPTVALATARALAIKRIRLCGDNIDLEYIRVSDVAVRGDAVLDIVGGYTTDKTSPKVLSYIKPVLASNNNPDVSWTSAIFQYSNNNIALARTFARGLPDLFFDGDRVFSPDGSWKNAFQDYAKELKAAGNAWGVLRRPKPAAGTAWKIRGAHISVGENLKIFMGPDFAQPVGTQIEIRGLKSTTGSYSGSVQIQAVLAEAYTVSHNFGFDIPSFLSNTGFVQLSAKTFVTPLTATFSTLATKRNAGRPFGALVGKQKKVIRLR